MKLVCQQCKEVLYVPECRGHIKFCSLACLVQSRKLDEERIQRIAARGTTRKDAAETLGIPYPTFYRKLKEQKLNQLFKTYRKVSSCLQEETL